MRRLEALDDIQNIVEGPVDGQRPVVMAHVVKRTAGHQLHRDKRSTGVLSGSEYESRSRMRKCRSLTPFADEPPPANRQQACEPASRRIVGGSSVSGSLDSKSGG